MDDIDFGVYFVNQLGGGMPFFAGRLSQRGHGFFGRLLSGFTGFMKKLAPSLGKRALPSAIGLAQDILSGENVGKSAKIRLSEAGKNMADETLDHIKTRLQSGSGIIGRNGKRYVNFKSPIMKKKRKTNKRKRKTIKKRKRLNRR